MDKRRHKPHLRNSARFLALYLSLALTLPNPAFALRSIQSQQSRGLTQAIASGLEKKFPDPVEVDAHPSFKSGHDGYHNTLLERDLQQEEPLTNLVLPDLIRRNAGTRMISFAFLGTSTGEEVARFWCWIREWFDAQGLAIGGENGWQIWLIAVENDQPVLEEAQRRFRGNSPFVYWVGATTESIRFAQQVVKAVEKDANYLAKAIKWIPQNMADRSVVEKIIREADFVVSNTASIHLISTGQNFWGRLCESPKAWLMTTDVDLQRVQPKTRRTPVIGFGGPPTKNLVGEWLYPYYLSSPPTAGMEETAPDILPGQSVREIIGQEGGMVPGAAQQMASQLYANRPEVRQVLQTNEGRLKITAEIAGKLSGRSDALGGLLITGSAADLPAEDFMVIADSDLNNPAAQRILAWIPAGSDSRQVAKTLGRLKAGSNQMALFEEEPGLTSERVQALVSENLGSASALRSVVGTQEQVRALPVIAFKVLGRMKGLPDVVFLGVAFTFKDKFDQEHSLIVWTQA